ncbi:MAG: efflux RND transporter periplasmic adaptor subunit [Limisphaerales bacterium]
MNKPPPAPLSQLRIDPAAKRRSSGTVWIIFAVVAIVALAALLIWRPWVQETVRLMPGGGSSTTNAAVVPSVASKSTGSRPTAGTPPEGAASGVEADIVLTVSGYIVNRERIELSPRFMGMVTWIGVKKGDVVTNGQVVVRLDPSEYTARLQEQQARLAGVKTAVEKAALAYQRVQALAASQIESEQLADDARLDLESARAAVQEIEGQIALTQTYLDWCVIRSPIDGVVLEKLVDPNELVTPQSFGGTRGPSTALIAVADTKDLQVEIDVNEADLGKVRLNQACRISPEAYLDRHYDGYVAEVAPEASRQKGTLQILEPDHFLTPELSAKVEFLRSEKAK